MYENGLVIIQNQSLSRKEQIVFTNLLGNALKIPSEFAGKDHELGFPEISRVTNFFSNGNDL